MFHGTVPFSCNKETFEAGSLQHMVCVYFHIMIIAKWLNMIWVLMGLRLVNGEFVINQERLETKFCLQGGEQKRTKHSLLKSS
jgi:hypothetical protein